MKYGHLPFLKAKDFSITNTYIAISENKPCGMMVTYKNRDNLYLDCISKFPLESNKEFNFVGDSLFYHLFEQAKKNNNQNICLRAVTGGPFDVVSKYKKLGFKDFGYVGQYLHMACNKFKINDTIQELSKDIYYEECEDYENVDLNKVCDIM